MAAKLLPLVAVAALSVLVSASPQQPSSPVPQVPARGGGFRQPDPIEFGEHDGWTSLFDGRTLSGWSGDANWKIEDGAIVIESTRRRRWTRPSRSLSERCRARRASRRDVGSEVEYGGGAIRFRRSATRRLLIQSTGPTSGISFISSRSEPS